MTDVASRREPAAPPFRRPIDARRLAQGRPIEIAEAADAAERAAVARALDLMALEALEIRGALAPAERRGWRFDGELRAELAQRCVATSEPAPASVIEPIVRVWLPEAKIGREPLVDDAVIVHPPGSADDDEPEPLEAGVDLGAVAVEALALALDPYPHAPGVEPVEAAAAPPGVEPLRDEDLKPFAALAKLKRKSTDDDEDGGASPNG